MSIDLKRLARQARLAEELVRAVSPLFNGKDPEVQGAALLDLCAIWLAGHHPDLRGEIQAEFFAALPGMIEANERILFGPAGFPRE
jgi:hypothetical protein